MVALILLLLLAGAGSGAQHPLCASLFSKAYDGGPLALVKNGDTILIDAKKRQLDLVVAKVELKRRMAKWKKPKARYKSGVLGKYSRHVGSASEGALGE